MRWAGAQLREHAAYNALASTPLEPQAATRGCHPAGPRLSLSRQRCPAIAAVRCSLFAKTCSLFADSRCVGGRHRGPTDLC